jgi:heme/copper-type cytochrome/quinol oxidase subunit 2
MPRIVEFRTLTHDNGLWGERFGFFIVHMLWMIPVTCFPFFSMLLVISDEDGASAIVVCMRMACSLFLATFSALMVWLFAFCRHKRDEAETPFTRHSWQRPADPWWGIFITLIVAFTVVTTIVSATWCDPGPKHGAATMVLLFLLVVPPMAYTLGLVAALPVALICTCPFCCLILTK